MILLQTICILTDATWLGTWRWALPISLALLLWPGSWVRSTHDEKDIFKMFQHKSAILAPKQLNRHKPLVKRLVSRLLQLWIYRVRGARKKLFWRKRITQGILLRIPAKISRKKNLGCAKYWIIGPSSLLAELFLWFSSISLTEQSPQDTICFAFTHGKAKTWHNAGPHHPFPRADPDSMFLKHGFSYLPCPVHAGLSQMRVLFAHLLNTIWPVNLSKSLWRKSPKNTCTLSY